MELYYLTLLLLYLSTSQSSLNNNIKDTLKEFLRKKADEKLPHSEPLQKQYALRYMRHFDDEAADALRAQNKAKVLRQARTDEHHLNHGRDINPYKGSGDPSIGKEYYHMDAVLNHIRRHGDKKSKSDVLKHVKRRHGDHTDETSSSLEMNDWKDDFNAMWLEKKFEAINSTNDRTDTINMVAARPWGVPCGDPNQHDMPWGSCMMTIECDSEYRIYRGDYFCGRTMYVCCAIQYTNYDLYQGFDVSFADTSFSTDSEEKRGRDKGSKEQSRKQKDKQKRKRQKERRKRKRKIKKQIRRIVHEIRKILNRSFRNSSHHRKQRTTILKKYIKLLKKQYKKDRMSVRDIHHDDMDKVDTALEKKLEQIRNVNKNFMINSTFRDIVVNGTISHTGARMLAQAYPELTELLRSRLRRGGGGVVDGQESDKAGDDYLGYDVEYGALYY